jgi:hypothetical protein
MVERHNRFLGHVHKFHTDSIKAFLSGLASFFLIQRCIPSYVDQLGLSEVGVGPRLGPSLRAFASKMSGLSAVKAGATCSILHLCGIISRAPITSVVVADSEISLRSLSSIEIHWNWSVVELSWSVRRIIAGLEISWSGLKLWALLLLLLEEWPEWRACRLEAPISH